MPRSSDPWVPRPKKTKRRKNIVDPAPSVSTSATPLEVPVSPSVSPGPLFDQPIDMDTSSASPPVYQDWLVEELRLYSDYNASSDEIPPQDAQPISSPMSVSDPQDLEPSEVAANEIVETTEEPSDDHFANNDNNADDRASHDNADNDTVDDAHSDDDARSDVSSSSSDYCGRPIGRLRELSYSRSPRTSDDGDNVASSSRNIGAKASLDRITGEISKMDVSAKQPRLDDVAQHPPANDDRDRNSHPLAPALPIVTEVPTSDLTTNATDSSSRTWDKAITLEDNVQLRRITKAQLCNRKRHVFEKNPAQADIGRMASTTRKPKGVAALFVVTDVHGRGRRAEALHLDLFLPDRPDLRCLFLGPSAVNTVDGKHYDPLNAFSNGAVIIVQEVTLSKAACKRSTEDILADPATACEVAGYQPTWVITKYQLARPTILRDRQSLAVRLTRTDRGDIVSGTFTVEGLPDAVEIPRIRAVHQLTADVPALLVDVLLPTSITPRFSSWPEDKDHKEMLVALARPLSFNYKTPPVTFRHRPLPERLLLKMTKFDSAASRINDERLALTSVMRAIATVDPACATLDNIFFDTMKYSASLRRSNEGGIDSVVVRLHITRATRGLSAKRWPSGRKMTIMDASNDIFEYLSGTVRFSELVGNDLFVTVALRGYDANRADQLWPVDVLRTVTCLQSPPPVSPTAKWFQYHYESRLNGRADSFHGQRAARIFRSLYSSEGPAHKEITARPLPLRYFNINGNRLPLHHQQKSVSTAFLNKDVDCFLVRSGPGCGKTLILTAASAFALSETDPGIHLILTTSNLAIVNAVNTADSLDDFTALPILRICSERLFRSYEARTRFDLPVLLRNELFKEEFWSSLQTDEERECVKTYRDSINEVSTDRLTQLDPLDEIGISDALASTAMPTYSTTKAIRLLLNWLQPRRLFSTVDSAIAAFAMRGPFATITNKVSLVAIDEASQLRDGYLLHLLHTFPSARLVLVGDDRQLSPHAPHGAEPFARHLAANKVIERIVLKDLVPILSLTRNFRSHHGLVAVSSRMFYKNTLLSGARYDDRSSIADRLYLPNRDVPFMMLSLPEGVEIDRRPSWSNDVEADFIAYLVRAFLQRGIQADEVAVLTSYKAQSADLRQHFDANPNLGEVFIGTIDACQGREWALTIVSTVRTSAKGVNDFISSLERVNVATSRSREATFVVYHPNLLSSHNPWSELTDLLIPSCTVMDAELFRRRQL